MSDEAPKIPPTGFPKGFTPGDRVADTPLAPVSLEASVIGTVLLHPELFPDVSYLRPQDFFLKRHRLLWQSILHLAQQGAQISPRVVQSLYNQNAKERGFPPNLASPVGFLPSLKESVSLGESVRKG